MNVLGATHDTLDDLPDPYEIKTLVDDSLREVNFPGFFGSNRSQFEREMGGAIHENGLNKDEAKAFAAKVAAYVNRIADYGIDTRGMFPPFEAAIDVTVLLTDLLRGRDPAKPNILSQHTKELAEMIQKFAKASKQFPSGGVDPKEMN